MSGAQNNPTGKVLAITGCVCLFGPILGLLGSVAMMALAFHTLGPNGISDPRMLAANVGAMLWVTVAGMVLMLIGVVLVTVSLIGCRYRAPWFFWFLVIDGAMLLFGFPVGTVVGLALLIFCFMQREEFLRDGSVAVGA